MNRSLLAAGLALSGMTILATAGMAAENGQMPSNTRAAEPRTIESGTCTEMTKVKFKSDNSIDGSTVSGSFVDVSGANVSFTQGGSSSGCVIVTFTAEVFAPKSRLMFVRARLDGSKNAAPGAVQLTGDDDEDGDDAWARSHSFTFIFPSVSPGSHQLNIQYRSGLGGERVFLGKHTTVLQYR